MPRRDELHLLVPHQLSRCLVDDLTCPPRCAADIEFPHGIRTTVAIGTGTVHIHILVSRIQKESSVQVFVRDNNVDQALKALKKKMQREGLFREMKLRGHYEKPSERRVREKAKPTRRPRNLARKKLQREGLLPMKPRKTVGAPGRGGPPRAPRF